MITVCIKEGYEVLAVVHRNSKRASELEKIEHCNDEDITKCFNIWKNATEINTSDTEPKNKYFVSIEKMKVRYINPLVHTDKGCIRVKDISDIAKEDIEKCMNYKPCKYNTPSGLKYKQNKK